MCEPILDLPDGTYVQFPGGGVLAGPHAGCFCVSFKMEPVYQTHLSSSRTKGPLLGHRFDLWLEDDDEHKFMYSVYEDRMTFFAELLARAAF